MSSTPEASDCGSGPAASKGRRRLRAKWVILIVAVLALAVSVGYLAQPKRDRMFRGQPESEWIKNLKYSDDKQVAEWQDYGEAGVQVLVRGLQNARRPGERLYRRINRALPAFLTRYLPDAKPDSTRPTRMCVVSLLGSLNREDAARSATPIMIWTVRKDEADEVRQSALNFLNSTEDERSLVNRLPPGQKQALLPALLSAVQNPRNWGLRNNAAISLRWFPEKREVVAPVLVKALQDPQPQVRVLVAEALNRVAPDVAAKAGTTSVLAAVAKHPDDQIAFRAVAALGHSGCDPALAVPALVESLQSTNSLVACQAVWALERAPANFNSFSNTIASALSEATRRNDSAGKYAKNALHRWEPKAPKPAPTEATR